jgi:hypothetical protein
MDTANLPGLTPGDLNELVKIKQRAPICDDHELRAMIQTLASCMIVQSNGQQAVAKILGGMGSKPEGPARAGQ